MTDDREAEAWGNKDGRAWRIGAEADVAWIRENTEVSFAITSAIPPVFEAYATLELPGSGDHRLSAASALEDPDRHTAGMLALLSEHSAGQPWWLGYLDTGGADIVFCDVPKVRPGPTEDARYVLVEAGPEQAGVWREREHSKGPMPDLMFPVDRSWLVSTCGTTIGRASAGRACSWTLFCPIPICDIGFARSTHRPRMRRRRGTPRSDSRSFRFKRMKVCGCRAITSKSTFASAMDSESR